MFCRFSRTGPEDIHESFFAGSLMRFADFRARQTGPENIFVHKSQAILPLAGWPVKLSGRLMTEPERFFGGSPMPFAHFRVHTPFGI